MSTDILKAVCIELGLDVNQTKNNEYQFYHQDCNYLVGYKLVDEDGEPAYYLRTIQSEERIISTVTIEDFMLDFAEFVDSNKSFLKKLLIEWGE